MADFSMELNEDQLHVLSWVHDFAQDVIRPAGARVGRARGDTLADHRGGSQGRPVLVRLRRQLLLGPDGLLLALVSEELAWGDAGIALSLLGSTLGVAGIMAAGTPEQVAEWVPRCFADRDEVAVAAFCVSEADAGSDVGNLKTRAVYDEANDTWTLTGPRVDHQRGYRAPPCRGRIGADPALGPRGQAAFVVPAGTPGCRWARSTGRWGSASHTAEVVLQDVRLGDDCLLGGKATLDERLAAPARESPPDLRLRWPPSRRPVRPLPPRRSASAGRDECALGYAKERKTFGRPISSVRRSRSSLPT